MPTWPAELPQAPERGLTDAEPFPVIQSPVDGPAKSRPRYTAAPSELANVQLRVTKEEREIFRAWYRDVIAFGALPFEWVDWATGVPCEYRITAAPQSQHVGGPVWLLTLSLIRLP